MQKGDKIGCMVCNLDTKYEIIVKPNSKRTSLNLKKINQRKAVRV